MTFLWKGSTATLAALLLLAAAGCATTGKELRLTREGQPAATIVVADAPLAAADGRGNPTLTQMTAAGELQKYIEKAGGVKLPIAVASQAPKKGTLILVGRSAVSDAYPVARRPTRTTS